MLLEIWTYISVVLSIAMCAIVVYFLFTGRDDRQKEEEAREYFDAHGHWPDEA
jgi:flagellar basal body-associated protein FliL